MAITEPFAHPATGIRSIIWAPEAVVAMTESVFTLRQQVQAHEGQRWVFTVNLTKLSGDTAEEWRGFFLKCNGRERTFLLGDPSRTTARGAATGTPLVKGASQTGVELVTDGWTTGVTGILKAGDYIQLGSGGAARLHQIVQDVDSDGSGNATLDIWPRLRVSPADNDPIVVAGCQGVFRLASNQMPVNIDEAKFHESSFTALEVI